MISIIVPVYKVEKYLDRCVESLVNQTYSNIEIILVDDGSPDNCPAICDKWAAKDNRIKVIHKPNGGVSSARNEAIKIAKGDYFTFVDSDDIIHPSMCEILLSNLKKYDADISMCNWQQILFETNVDYKILNYEEINVQEFSNDECFDLLFNKKVPMIMTVWNKLYKREIFNDIKYPENIAIGEDEYSITYVMNKCKKLVYFDYPLYFNTKRDDSAIGSKFTKKRLQAVSARHDRWQFCVKNKPEFEQKALSQYLITLANFYTKSKRAKLDKSIIKQLNSEFNACYKLLKNKSIYHRIFKFCKPLYALILWAKEKFLD